MTTSHADLPVVVDRRAAAPLAAQISTQVREAVTAGVLGAGERLPSTRDLAGVLGVSRTVVTTAYAQLFAEGWLEGRHGSGTYVADVATGMSAAPDREARNVHAPSYVWDGAPDMAALDGQARDVIELRPGIPWAAGVEPAVWRRAWRSAGAHPPSFWPDPHGLPELRAELAAYLRRSRGLGISPANVLVTRGVSAGLTLLAAALVRPGEAVGVEEPGYPAAREVLRRAGARVVPCRVDAHGIVPDELPRGLRLLYTTPAHQYPLGGRLPVGRRQALVSWARATGAVVVEDDYDSEFRYDVGPLPALHSMDPDVIVYLGTASKVLAPGFGAGWLVATPGLVERLAELRTGLGERVPEPVQHAMLTLLTTGDLERHVRRMRLEYGRRRAALVETLTCPDGAPGTQPRNGPEPRNATQARPAAHTDPAPAGALAPGTFRLLGDTAGMHVVLELPAGYPTDHLVGAAEERGIALLTVDRYFAGPPTLNALILGYGAAPLTRVRRAAAELRALLAAAPPASGQQAGQQAGHQVGQQAGPVPALAG
jgi:GntR family transcriptional regulator / MocR family aminotransferase